MFWNKCSIKDYCFSNIEKLDISIWFTIWKLVQIPSFVLYKQFLFVSPSLANKNAFDPNKFKITIDFRILDVPVFCFMHSEKNIEIRIY